MQPPCQAEAGGYFFMANLIFFDHVVSRVLESSPKCKLARQKGGSQPEGYSRRYRGESIPLPKHVLLRDTRALEMEGERSGYFLRLSQSISTLLQSSGAAESSPESQKTSALKVKVCRADHSRRRRPRRSDCETRQGVNDGVARRRKGYPAAA